jgi:hypothetical protein
VPNSLRARQGGLGDGGTKGGARGGAERERAIRVEGAGRASQDGSGDGLDEIEAAVPDDLDVHLVMDNYATHKTPLIRNWLVKRPRWHVHLTPTSASWLNQVERFFALITERKIRRGVYRSVVALRADIMSFIEAHNADPKPFRWTKSADAILASIERFCAYNQPASA